MSPHLTEDRILDFVLGSQPEPDIEEVKRHLSECSECAGKAAHEAAMDHALWEARQHVEQCPGCHQTATGDPPPDRCDQCGVAFRVGRYEIIEVLVRTDHSRLYLAVDESGHQVALKELVFSQVPDVATLEAFEREARLLRQLDHPQIPRFLDAFQEGDGVRTRLYLAQEFVTGKSLLQRLDEHRFTEAEALEIARQVLGVLAYLQRLSPPVFHRDVKPANLIQKDDGTVVLVDFGAARDLGATQGGTAVGTFGYMPMEQLTGAVDSTSDLYSLGATLVHLLSRRAPWEVLGQQPLAQTVSVSTETRRFLETLLARETKDRLPSAEAALAFLEGRQERSQARQKRRHIGRNLLMGGVALASASMGWATMASWELLPTPDFFQTISWLRVSGAVSSGDFSTLDKVFLACAVIGGILFLVRLILQVLGGHGSDGDLHVDGDLPVDGDLHVDGDVDHGDMDHGDVDHGDMDADVKLLTLQGIMAFMVMFGLVGLALSRQSGFGALFSLLGALVAGVAAMWVIGKIFTLAMRLRSSGTVVNTSAIGQGGTVYLNIPAGGQGKVHVVVQNRLREFEAISHGDDAIKTGEKVRVVAVKDGRIMVVERIATAEGKGE